MERSNMNWKDTITLTIRPQKTYSNKDKGISIAIERSAIRSLSQYEYKDYSMEEPIKVSRILVDLEMAMLFHIPINDVCIGSRGVFVDIEEEYTIVLNLLRGNPGAEVLFTK